MNFNIGRIQVAPIVLLTIITGCIETDIEDPFPESLRIIKPTEPFYVSGQYELMAEFTDDTGEPADVDITWESSDEDILRIDGSEAVCLAEGLVFLQASAGNISENILINVEPSRELIEISNFVEILQVGTSFIFEVTYMDESGALEEITPNWTSSNETIASVDNLGEVTALDEGTVTITASFGNVSHQVMLESINDPIVVDPEIRITTFSMFLQEGESFSYAAEYFGEDGQPDPTATINWSSSNTTVLSIGSDGLAMAHVAGSAIVTASFNGMNASVEVTVEAAATERSGTLTGTGYNISGAFKLSKNSDGDLILTIENFMTAGPGPYFYLSNQSTNVANGLNLGDAKINGNVEINVSAVDSSAELNTYQYLIIWCEPFGVRLGFGEFDN